MTTEIALTLAILLITIILFISDKLRVDLVALLVLGGLVLTGLVTPTEALSGFSSPAVVTVWAVFILSGGLSRTGVANALGRRVLRITGSGETRLLVIIMLISGVLSAFMNNIGVAAMLLPVVIHIARQKSIPPSKLLMPMAFGALLGGMTTLIGTPPNILASGALVEYGLQPFQFFDFVPVGLSVMLASIAFMAILGSRLLPDRDLTREFGKTEHEFRQVFALKEQLFVVRLPANSALSGKTLAETSLGPALDLNVIGILRDESSHLVPGPDTKLRANDRLLVAGQPEQLDGLQYQHPLVLSEESPTYQNLVSEYIGLAELRILPESSLVGKTIEEVDFRQRYGANVLGVCHKGTPIRTQLQQLRLNADDTLLIQAPRERLDQLDKMSDLNISPAGSTAGYRLQEQLFSITIPEGSYLAGRTLAQTHLGDAFDLNVLCIVSPKGPHLMPGPGQLIQAGDTLIIEGSHEDLDKLGELQEIQIDRDTQPQISDLETEEFGIVEAVLSPHTTLAGKHLRQIHFRDKFGLNVLAIWREGQAYYSNLRDMALKFGDALLLQGRREKLLLLRSEADFILLEEEIQVPPRQNKAPIALLIMVAVVGIVLLGWLPIAIAAVIGGSLMILTGCISMEEAYHDIDWRAVFLIAGMVPLGIAMQTTGTADFLANLVVDLVGDYGIMAVLAGLFLMTSLASQFMPNAIVTVLMAPIAINTANSLQASPYALMMAIAVAASAAFLSPVGHPANILVMGPGGYRFSDYIRVGLPLTIIVMIVALVTIPIFWPLTR